MRQPFDLVRVPAVLSQYVRVYYRLLSITFRYVYYLSPNISQLLNFIRTNALNITHHNCEINLNLIM